MYCSPVDTSSNADGIINSLNKVFIIIIIINSRTQACHKITENNILRS